MGKYGRIAFGGFPDGVVRCERGVCPGYDIRDSDAAGDPGTLTTVPSCWASHTTCVGGYGRQGKRERGLECLVRGYVVRIFFCSRLVLHMSCLLRVLICDFDVSLTSVPRTRIH